VNGRGRRVSVSMRSLDFALRRASRCIL
jgi:hypothetical protein